MGFGGTGGGGSGSLATSSDVAVSAPSNNQILTYDGTIGKWKNAAAGSGSAPDANPTTKGLVQLTGDLSGTAASPTVPGLADKEPTIVAGVSTQYYRGDKSWQTLNASAVGLGNVTNVNAVARANHTGSQTASTISDFSTAADARITAQKGTANGLATLDGSQKITASQLPSYVDEVEEYANLAAFPVTGVSGRIYIALNTNKTYRWSGSTYVEMVSSPGTTDAISEGATNLYFTTSRASNAAPVQSVASRTGAVVLTKTDVGLANVDNTADSAKPVSTAQQTAINLKATDTAVVHLSGTETVTGSKNFTGGLQSGGQVVVVTNDSRLSDQRTPSNTSVTVAKLSAANSPTSGQILSYNGTTFNWIAAPTGGSDPTMGGDMSGTASNAQIVAGAVGATELASNSVTTVKIVDGNVTTLKIVDNAITTTKILDAAVTEPKLAASNAPAANQVLSWSGSTLTWVTPIASDPSVGGDISGTITNAQIVAGAVGATELASNAVITAKILDANVTAAKLASDSVTTAKILDGNVTAIKLADGNVSASKLGADSVTTIKILDSNVTTAKVADSAITEPKLSITNSPATNQVLSWNGSAMAWATPSSGGSGGFTPVARTTSYSAVDGNFVVGNAASAGFTVTLPVASAGAWIKVKKVDSTVNAILVVAQSGVQIDDQTSISVNQQWLSYDFLSDGTKWYRV